MPRATTTSDAFNAVAEPRRRLLIDVLARRGTPCAVNDIVQRSRLPQPTVSKHLGVLRAVGLVRVHARGRQRLYALNPDALRPVNEWIRTFDRFWDDHLDAIKHAAEKAAAKRQAPGPAAPKMPGNKVSNPEPKP